MEFKYVVAIVRPEGVASLEPRLHSIGIGGITLTKVKGFGNYKNYFSRDHLSEHTKVEIFVEASKVDALLQALHELAIGVPGAGVVAVMPVDRFVHFRAAAATLPPG